MTSATVADADLDSPAQFSRRLALARPSDTAIGGTVVAALAYVEEMGGPAALSDVRGVLPSGVTFNESFRYHPSHTLLVFDAWARWAVAHRRSNYAREVSALGDAWGRRVMSTPVGRTIQQISGGDPIRMLSSLGGALHANSSFAEGMFERLDGTGRLRVRRQLYGAAWMMGMVRTTLQVVAGKALPLRCTLVDSATAADFDLEIEQA
jgi:uncharacterized protein (TIGR02265 family)